ncbi:MAG: hypothetical protein SGI77_13940 [Pirellulaceae bacterium]|nr:hypothetical protein [Pirellulaceae bacterium]
MNWTDILSTGAQIATAASVLIAAASILLAKEMFRKQMNADLFTTFTTRYENIVGAFPPELRFSRFDRPNEAIPLTEDVLLGILRYLNLCSEEFYLWKAGLLDKKIWCIWEDELIKTLRSRTVVAAWHELSPEFSSYPEFVRFVEETQA